MQHNPRRDSFLSLVARWTGAACTLNGQPARVSGRLYYVAIVEALDVAGGAMQLSWHRVNQMMLLAGGRFYGKAAIN